MSSYDYSRSKARHTAALAAPSAFGSFEEEEQQHHAKRAEYASGTHYMPGDDSKIFNPKTGKYVKIDGKVGHEVIAEFGYPMQQGGNTFDDISNQLSKSFSDLYDNLASTWKNLTGSYSTAKGSRKASAKGSRKASTKALEEGYPFQEPKPRKRNKKRQYAQTGGDDDIYVKPLGGDLMSGRTKSLFGSRRSMSLQEFKNSLKQELAKRKNVVPRLLDEPVQDQYGDWIVTVQMRNVALEPHEIAPYSYLNKSQKEQHDRESWQKVLASLQKK